MSFLEQLQAKRNKLKLVETIVRKADGRRFVESKNQEEIEIATSPYGFVVDSKPDDVPSKILPNLFLGSQDCCEFSVLEKYAICCVLSVGVEAPCVYPHVTYKFAPCLDLPETKIKDVLLKICIPFLTDCVKSNSNVLVHCNAGVSRSPSIVVGYLILVEGYNYDDAYNFVKSVRNCMRPNDGFAEQLRRLGNATDS